MEESVLFCISFDFGVPLEDIFPSNSIHPKLQNLFCQTYLSLKYSFKRIENVLDSHISLTEALYLKDSTIDGSLTYKIASPSSFLWLLRHFLGLLPLPLFPKFTDGQTYQWEYLAVKCRQVQFRRNDDLESEISWWIHTLPKPNVMLIYVLINFFRRICVSHFSRKLKWESVRSATIYFCSCLFMRPFRPGLTKDDDLYYPLLCYLIMKWSRIKKNEKYLNKNIKYASYDLVKASKNDCCCQTSSWLLLDLNTRNILDRVEEEPYPLPELCEKAVQTRGKSLTGNTFNFNITNTNIENFQSDGETQVVRFLNMDSEYEKFENNIQNVSKEPSYEEIGEDKNVNSNSATFICTDDKFSSKIIFKEKMLKANKSIANALSKMNEKLKSKQDLLKSKSGSKVDNIKYNMLKDVTKIQSLHANHTVKESPNIKYKKLMTL